MARQWYVVGVAFDRDAAAALRNRLADLLQHRQEVRRQVGTAGVEAALHHQTDHDAFAIALDLRVASLDLLGQHVAQLTELARRFGQALAAVAAFTHLDRRVDLRLRVGDARIQVNQFLRQQSIAALGQLDHQATVFGTQLYLLADQVGRQFLLQFAEVFRQLLGQGQRFFSRPRDELGLGRLCLHGRQRLFLAQRFLQRAGDITEAALVQRGEGQHQHEEGQQQHDHVGEGNDPQRRAAAMHMLILLRIEGVEQRHRHACGLVDIIFRWCLGLHGRWRGRRRLQELQQ